MARNETEKRPGGNQTFRLGDWTVSPETCRLHQSDREVRLEPRSMAVLEYLAERPGEVVTRQELEESIWSGTVVGYKAVTNVIIKLRKALSDDARCPHYIETISKHGYRLIAEVGDVRSQSAMVTGQPARKPSIAVKPFEDMGPEAEHERLGDTFTSGLVVALTRIHGLVLVDDDSPGMISSREMTVEEIARRFEVRHVLKGSVRKQGSRMRVTAELLEAASGRVLWADSLDREFLDFGDFFGVQDEVVEEIVTAMDVKLLSGEAARIVRKALRNPAALECYYRGEDLLWRATTKLELHDVQGLFENTIRLEPDSSVGYAAGSLAYWAEACSGLDDTNSLSLERAVELAREAIERGDVTGYGHMVLAHTHLNRREFERAMAEADCAVSDRPSCPTAYSIKASVLTYLDRPNEAIEFARYALRLTPVHPPLYPAVLAAACYGCGRHEEAVAAANAAVELDSNELGAHVFLTASNAALGRMVEAREAARSVLRLEPKFTLADFAASQPYKQKQTLDRLITRLRQAGLS